MFGVSSKTYRGQGSLSAHGSLEVIIFHFHCPLSFTVAKIVRELDVFRLFPCVANRRPCRCLRSPAGPLSGDLGTSRASPATLGTDCARLRKTWLPVPGSLIVNSRFRLTHRPPVTLMPLLAGGRLLLALLSRFKRAKGFGLRDLEGLQ